MKTKIVDTPYGHFDQIEDTLIKKLRLLVSVFLHFAVLSSPMLITHPHIQLLIECIRLEEAEQVARYSLDQQHTLRELKAAGVVLHPIIVTRKNFGYAEYPEISFRLNFPPASNLFRDGAAIECFKVNEAPIKGILLELDSRQGSFRLYAPDFPEWIEEDGVGIKLAPDQRTTSIMKTVLQNIVNEQELFSLFNRLHGHEVIHKKINSRIPVSQFSNNQLNESQQQAVNAIIQNDEIIIVHGPPGTGKTTTLAEAVSQLVATGEKVLVSAPSNTAVDHLSKSLLSNGLNILRVGNTSKVDPLIFPHTPEGKLSDGRIRKEIKELRIRAEQLRSMALKYKRSYGKAEREQRNLLFREVKSIRQEIKKIQAYNESKLYENASVIIGTPIGLYDAALHHYNFDTLVIDEAGQCLEPLAWCIFPLARKIVLAGDHFQLPPTVLSNEAMQLGFNKSILEVAMEKTEAIHLLDTQYRMRQSIAGFSGVYFYDSLLQSAPHLPDIGVHLIFIDMAGSGFQETAGTNGASLKNDGELLVTRKIMEQDALDIQKTAFISPYNGQVDAAFEMFAPGLRISSIDSFQGQEKEVVILSLVRSNDANDIGFLKDYRRMNVAITRAKELLYVIGDSATIGADPFYNAFLEYVEKHGSYRSVWEYEIYA